MWGQSEPDVLLSRQDIEIAFLAQVLHLKQFERNQPNEKSIKKAPTKWGFFNWWRGGDLNSRPSGYEPDELPDCSTPRRPFNHTTW